MYPAEDITLDGDDLEIIEEQQPIENENSGVRDKLPLRELIFPEIEPLPVPPRIDKNNLFYALVKAEDPGFGDVPATSTIAKSSRECPGQFPEPPMPEPKK